MPGRRPTPETLSSGRKLTTLTLARTFPDPPNCFWFSYPFALLVAGFWLAGEGGGFDFDGLRSALSAPLGFLAGWTHFIAFDLFVGAWILRESTRIEVEPRVYLAFTLMTGPLGLGSFLLRRWLRLRQLGHIGDTNLI